MVETEAKKMVKIPDCNLFGGAALLDQNGW
jgi:hypothetical protein